MVRRVTPPKRVTSHTGGTPPLCKQALRLAKQLTRSKKTVQRLLRSEGYKRSLAKKKMVVQEANRKSESSGVKSEEVEQ